MTGSRECHGYFALRRTAPYLVPGSVAKASIVDLFTLCDWTRTAKPACQYFRNIAQQPSMTTWSRRWGHTDLRRRLLRPQAYGVPMAILSDVAKSRILLRIRPSQREHTMSTRYEKEYDRAIIILGTSLKGSCGPNDRRWLLDLHRDYTTRFLSDNNRIWMTTSIFTGFAIAGIGITIGNSTIHPFLLLVVGVISVTLLCVWNQIADRHRDFQDISLAWLHAIESKVLLDGNCNVHDGEPTTSLPRAQDLRRRLTWIVAAGWTGLFMIQVLLFQD